MNERAVEVAEKVISDYLEQVGPAEIDDRVLAECIVLELEKKLECPCPTPDLCKPKPKTCWKR